MGTTGGRSRGRGSIDLLPSGAYRVRVYEGVDPLTGKQLMLTERVPPGPGADKEAERARTRLLSQVDERRNPRTRATLDQLLERYLEVVELERSTRRTYEGYLDRHVRPALGKLRSGRSTAKSWTPSMHSSAGAGSDATASNASPTIGRRTNTSAITDAGHTSASRSPLNGAQIHWILSGAFERAVRWKWISVSPTDAAEPPPQPKPKPSPPTAAEAASILNEAWKDPRLGHSRLAYHGHRATPR